DIGEKGANRDVDTITDFGTGNDKLHLSDLLQGETLKDTTSMQEYVSWDSGTNTLHISSTGGYAGGQYTVAQTDLDIKLTEFTGTQDELINNYII
ncbi:MAG: type I secretion C-terminal target domain-containing protein, partial [Psychrobacter sp.]